MFQKVLQEIVKLEGCNINCSHCKKITKAALEALREPTNDMANNYYQIRKSVGDTDKTAVFNVSVWQSSIDAALKDHT